PLLPVPFGRGPSGDVGGPFGRRSDADPALPFFQGQVVKWRGCAAGDDLPRGRGMGPDVVRADFVRRAAKVAGETVVGFLADLHNLSHAIRREHPFQRLSGEIVAARAAEAGSDDDFAANRRAELRRANLELRAV